MREPKFKVGQLVERDFNGDVEGVKVTVTRKLWVAGVYFDQQSWVNSRHGLYYTLTEQEPESNGGRRWDDVQEETMREVEPVVEAIQKANETPVQGG